MRVLIKSNGLLDTAPTAPLMHPATNLFHAGAGVASSGCNAMSAAGNNPMRKTFFELSRTMATGKPLYGPLNAPSFFTIFIMTSRIFFPQAAPAPGSCISVFARSIGFVTSTATHDAAAAFGIDSHRGNASLCALSTLARGSVSVLGGGANLSFVSRRRRASVGILIFARVYLRARVCGAHANARSVTAYACVDVGASARARVDDTRVE
mmetsp:Transcript_2596/g.9432  ORF Transcript_2596/g.9432 Transcript_2596/m.9432 type:complete len:209 (+) Transcript_2596:1453-2079(+)